ncbi:deoxyribonuclease-1 [Ambystoma mexicanum]|uniref:deoxyribonuclease-1 n=1 Tax=Ambystoma mexicanum TaxID=8296 RepID=UPI0037E7DC4A
METSEMELLKRSSKFKTDEGLFGLITMALVVLCVLSMATLLNAESTFKIGAFNIQIFGDTKMNKDVCSNVIVQILARYDIVVVQEVRDSDLSAVTPLMEKLNSLSEHTYAYAISDPLGRQSHKEQYLFIYRSDTVSVVDSYHYHDQSMYSGVDVFSREPFVMKFRSTCTAIKEYVLVPLHAAPKDAVRELDALYDVYEDILKEWQTDNILFLGDFNSDCSYVKEDDWCNIRLRTDQRFQWLIPDDMDTTVSHSHCAYDRIVASGKKMKNAIVPGSAGVFDYQEAFELTQEQALEISDHFPVEMDLKLA